MIYCNIFQTVTTKNRIKLIIFDLDQTLKEETIFPQTNSILEYLYSKGYYIAMASYNPYAYFFCDRYGITKYFDMITGFRSDNKFDHIKKIKKFYSYNNVEIKDQEILFVDDMKEVICDIKSKTLINCLKVNPLYGVNKEELFKTLNKLNTS